MFNDSGSVPALGNGRKEPLDISPVVSKARRLEKMTKHRKLDETARLSWAVFIAFWVVFSFVSILMHSGCSPAARQNLASFFGSAKKCAGDSVGSIVKDVASRLLVDVTRAVSGGTSFDSDQWKQAGVGYASTYGADILGCAASSLFNQLSAPAPTVNGMTVRSSRVSVEEVKPYLDSIFETAMKKR